jgi:hypothetical protein
VRTAWLIWLAATLSLGAYAASGYLASRSESIPITLSPGFTANQKLFRFGQDHLRMELEFRGQHTNRPELGEHVSHERPGDRLQYPNPGSEIILKASSDSSLTLYSALPKTGHGQDSIYRALVAELNEGSGIWKWPPASRGLALKRGTNDVLIEVANVGRELAGENVRLLIHSEIGFKACGSQVCWLWGWFAWPFFLVVQLIWAFVLFRTSPGRKVTAASE